MANPQSVPSLREVQTATPRLISLSGEVYREGGAIIIGTYSRDPLNTSNVDYLRAGLVMGTKTTGGKFAPSIIGVLASAYDKDGSFDEVMTVSVATAVEIVRRIGATGSFNVTGPPSAAGTVATFTASEATQTPILIEPTLGWDKDTDLDFLLLFAGMPMPASRNSVPIRWNFLEVVEGDAITPVTFPLTLSTWPWPYTTAERMSLGMVHIDPSERVSVRNTIYVFAAA